MQKYSKSKLPSSCDPFSSIQKGMNLEKIAT